MEPDRLSTKPFIVHYLATLLPVGDHVSWKEASESFLLTDFIVNCSRRTDKKFTKSSIFTATMSRLLTKVEELLEWV